MKILYLAHRIPFPPNKGDKIRSFNEIKYLSKNHEIHLCCLVDNPKDLQYGNDLKKYCKTVNTVSINPKLAKLKSLIHIFSFKPLSIPYFYSQNLQKKINHLLSDINFDCILCFSSSMAEYIFLSKFFNIKIQNFSNTNPCLIMDFCDVDSNKWHQYSKSSMFPFSYIYKLESHRLSNYETRIAENFDHSIFISEKEVDIFQKKNPHINNINFISNGVNSDYFNPEKSYSINIKSDSTSIDLSKNNFPTLLFTGAMDYHANIEGVVWFCEEIFPKIKTIIPEVLFYIVGSNPTFKIQRLQSENSIVVTGYVEDIRPYYQLADVCVIPLRVGQGVQNKVLEAMAMGKATITTSKAIEGINVIPGEHLLVENKPETFSQIVLMLLKDKLYRKQLGIRARQFVKDNYNWDANMEKFEEFLGLHFAQIDA